MILRLDPNGVAHLVSAPTVFAGEFSNEIIQILIHPTLLENIKLSDCQNTLYYTNNVITKGTSGLFISPKMQNGYYSLETLFDINMTSVSGIIEFWVEIKDPNSDFLIKTTSVQVRVKPARYDESPIPPFPEIDKTKTTLHIDNRTVKVPENLREIVVEGDANSKSITYQMRRYFDENDLSDKNIIIKYVNANNQGDWYVVSDVRKDDQYIYFVWLFDERVTAKNGIVNYTIEFSDLNTGKYILHTIPSFFNIERGLDVDEHIVMEFPSVIEKLIRDFNRLMSGEILPEGNGIPEAPKDGKIYARQDGEWTKFQGAFNPEEDIYILKGGKSIG